MGKPQYEAKVKEALTIPPSGPVFKGLVINLVSSSRKKAFLLSWRTVSVWPEKRALICKHQVETDCGKIAHKEA